MRIPSKTLDQVATEVGRSCYWWGNIEFRLQILCVKLARFNDESLRQVPAWNVLSTVLSHMDARQRIAVAKALAAQSIDPDMYAPIERLLNTVDNELRSERNRFVHDQWELEEEVIVRRRHGAHVVRPQSRQLTVEQTKDRRYVDLAEVGAFAGRVADALAELIALEAELDDLYEEIWPDAEALA
ncbi:hypothetical protein [uncultured Sphingomonas sp.]|uniref:hypothetical protein n=1 Tax=uncultured Sphingomonas sp. TaxID=158754 RepID=UPI0035CBA434